MTESSSRSHLIPHVLRRLLRRRETVRYPFGPLKLDDNYRGRVVLDVERCVGCGRCARACPSGCLTVERVDGGGVRVGIHHGRCGSCGLCELDCPREAIHLVSAFVAPATSKEALVEEWERDGKPRDRT